VWRFEVSTVSGKARKSTSGGIPKTKRLRRMA
jgi:hypothetical protein